MLDDLRVHQFRNGYVTGKYVLPRGILTLFARLSGDPTFRDVRRSRVFLVAGSLGPFWATEEYVPAYKRGIWVGDEWLERHAHLLSIKAENQVHDRIAAWRRRNGIK